MKKWLWSVIAALLFMSAANDAFARAGGGRSSGRSFRSAPSGGGYYGNRNQPGYQQQHQQQPQQRGSFMRGLAGGIAGGFLGSMLFSSLGYGSGFGMHGGGGMGFLEILLFAGLGYMFFRWWRTRQQPAAAYSSPMRAYVNPETTYTGPNQRSLAIAIDPEQASDLFFRVQGAWTRRDLAPIQNILGHEIAANLANDIDDLKQRRQINRLENISVRSARIVDNWQESGIDYSRVHFLANLLDYTVDQDSGRLIEGSDSMPVKFEEYWVFAKTSPAADWQLVAIEQA